MAVSRRRFLKLGLFGGVVIVGATILTRGVFWGAKSRLSRRRGYEYAFLTERDCEAVFALIPAILVHDAFGVSEAEREELYEETLQAVDAAIASFQPAIQSEIRQLFHLLALAPARMFLAGVWRDWSRTDAQTATAFLNRWRFSRFNIFRSGYDALQQLVLAAWYGNPKSWSGIGYPGPPNLGEG